jgi:hypothetical protein
MKLNEFFEKLNESYSHNHKMTQIIKSDEDDKKHTKWMLEEMKIHNSNLDKFSNKYSNKSSFTQEKYYYDFYLFMMEEIKRVRDQSVEFMSVSEKEKYYKSIKKYDLSFKKEIDEVLNIIKNPDTHIPINKPNQGCLILFILPPLIYILTLIS